MNEYHSEDITYCMNRECKVMKCERNPKNIKEMKPHSFASLEDTDYCEKGATNNDRRKETD